MPFCRFVFPILLSCCIFPALAVAQDLSPFSTSNQNPLVAIYGLPATAPGKVLDNEQSEMTIRIDIASLCSRISDADESVYLDGESYRYTLAFKRGIGRNLEVGMEIPYVMHSEGFLDNFIENWHDFFNLPQGERDEIQEDQLTYSYQSESSSVLLEDEENGFGDLRLTGGWQIRGQGHRDDHHLALRASLKLPTGDEDKLLGSGSTDLALWLSSSSSFRQQTVALFGSAGLLLMTDGDVMPEQQRNFVGFGSLGAVWQAFDSVSVKIQFDGHTAFYDDSDFSELGESIQMILGGGIALSENTLLDLGVSEDIVVDSAPDVVFHLALRIRY